MIDAITDQIVRQLNDLPIVKKKAILELIRENTSTTQQHKDSLETWRKNLLSTSIWTDAEIDEIYQAREYINKWQPKQFF